MSTTKSRAIVSDDEGENELPLTSKTSTTTSADTTDTDTATLYPVSKGNTNLDRMHATLTETAKEENELKRQLAAAEAKAKANGKELSVRERKMIELKMKRIAGTKANALGVAEESKKHELKAQGIDVDGTGEGKKQITNKEFQDKKREWTEEQQAKGYDPALSYLHETAENAEYRSSVKKGKNELKKASFGWEVFNQDAQFNAYQKRLNYLPTTEADAAAAAAVSSTASSTAVAALPSEDVAMADASLALSYGKSSKPSKAGVERMVAELEEGQKRREKFSRRRAFNEDEDVTYINERNRIFNKKMMRAYEPYTLEIKQNLERGTAL